MKRTAPALGLLVLAAFIVDLRLQPGGERVTRSIDDFVQFFAAATAAVSGTVRARRERGRVRLSWHLLAAGTGCWAVGQAIWTYYEVIAATATPFPSLADAGYLLLPVLAAVVLPFAADGGTLPPSNAQVSKLGPLTVVTYYMAEPDGFHVVMTVAKTDGDASSVVRFADVLADGQQVVMSVPREAGKANLEVVVSRQGQVLSVSGPVGE